MLTSGVRLPLRHSAHQLAQPDEIVGGGGHGKHPAHARQTTVPGLIQLFNAEDARGRGIRVINGGELADAIKVALANRDGATLIECVIDRDDCSSDLISWGRMVAAANARPTPATIKLL